MVTGGEQKVSQLSSCLRVPDESYCRLPLNIPHANKHIFDGNRNIARNWSSSKLFNFMNEEEEEEEKIKIEGSIMWGWRKIWATVHNGTEAQMEITKLKKFVAHQRNIFASFALLFRSFMYSFFTFEIDILKFVEFTGEHSIQFYRRGLGYLGLKDQSPRTEEWGDGVGVWMTIFLGARTLGFQGQQEGISGCQQSKTFENWPSINLMRRGGGGREEGWLNIVGSPKSYSGTKKPTSYTPIHPLLTLTRNDDRFLVRVCLYLCSFH